MATNDPSVEQLRERIERLDRLIEEREDGHRGLGVRLALGIAHEMKLGLAAGQETSALVARWVERFGAEAVDDAVAQARALLSDPAKMATELQLRMQPPAAETSDA